MRPSRQNMTGGFSLRTQDAEKNAYQWPGMFIPGICMLLPGVC